MKKLLRHACSILSLLIIPVGLSSYSQKAKAQESSSLKPYEQLDDGTQIWRIWKGDSGAKSPEIAVLLVPKQSQSYKELVKDPKAFLNSRKVFSKNTNSVRGQSTLRLSHSYQEKAARLTPASLSFAADPALGVAPVVLLAVHDPGMSDSGIASLTFDSIP
jgi:hypothetical protein